MDFNGNEVADVSATDVLSVRLQEEIEEFRTTLAKEKKGLKKSDLVKLLTAIVENPVEASVDIEPNYATLYSLGVRTKQTLIHLTIKGLEEQAFNFEGDENGNVSEEEN